MGRMVSGMVDWRRGVTGEVPSSTHITLWERLVAGFGFWLAGGVVEPTRAAAAERTARETVAALGGESTIGSLSRSYTEMEAGAEDWEAVWERSEDRW